MRSILSVFFSIVAISAAADSIAPTFPALYSVTGVEADDQLNIRAAPDGVSEIIGQLANDATDVEVFALSRKGQWALLNSGETSGWVALRFLVPQPESRNALGLPNGLVCSGTEPFWDMRFLDEGALTLRTPETETQHALVSTAPSADYVRIAETGYRFVWQSEPGDVTAHILPGHCSDGMSDRTYGLHYIDNQGPRVGCCSLR